VRELEIARAAVTVAETVVAAAGVLEAGDAAVGAVDVPEVVVVADATVVTAAVAAEAGTKLLCHGSSRITRINNKKLRPRLESWPFFVLTAGKLYTTEDTEDTEEFEPYCP